MEPLYLAEGFNLPMAYLSQPNSYMGQSQKKGILLDHPFVPIAGRKRNQRYTLCNPVHWEGNCGKKLLSAVRRREE